MERRQHQEHPIRIKSIPFAGGLWDLTLYGGWHTTPEECVVAVKRYDRDSDSSNARPRG
ncbi:deazapurine DNA modification protein DpdA family protein, partial [Mycobacterium avium]|uniref:deazapurine DNA modification protein DpdA family protein n=2 Tax=Mycobacteriaceae TaxID=1762 RepID=UPI003FEED731